MPARYPDSGASRKLHVTLQAAARFSRRHFCLSSQTRLNVRRCIYFNSFVRHTEVIHGGPTRTAAAARGRGASVAQCRMYGPTHAIRTELRGGGREINQPAPEKYSRHTIPITTQPAYTHTCTRHDCTQKIEQQRTRPDGENSTATQSPPDSLRLTPRRSTVLSQPQQRRHRYQHDEGSADSFADD